VSRIFCVDTNPGPFQVSLETPAGGSLTEVGQIVAAVTDFVDGVSIVYQVPILHTESSKYSVTNICYYKYL
jgi:hypothetical protein